MKYIVLLLSCVYFTYSVVLPSIPEHLVACYRAGGPPLRAPRRLDVFLSLLKKVELDSKLDTRLLATSLLRSLRLDGIEESSEAIETEFVLPFRASSFQFHKYKILMDLFLPSQDLLTIDEILALDEKCMIHKMLSSTVRRWERGDENVVCPISVQTTDTMATQNSRRIHSRCPIEDGVIQTRWGPVAVGTVVAAVAASLEPQSVSVTEILNQDVFSAGIAEPLMTSAKQEWLEDIETLPGNERTVIPEAEINNIWAATLAGDLAEVVINQGPRFGASSLLVIGSNNRWNDTLLPRDHYILPQNATFVDWQFTDAEILAGIDGLILSNYVPEWLEERRTLRLSQIMEMYYSNEGVSFDSNVKACERRKLFRNVFNATHLASQTSRLAHVLSLWQITVYIPFEEIDRISAAAATVFENYLNSILNKYHKACEPSHSIPVMDLVVVTDSSWKGYDVEQFMSWMGDALEINMQRSTLALMHGNTAQWIVPPADNLTTVFSHIHNFTDEWPNRLNLPNIISAVMQLERNKSLRAAAACAASAAAVLVLSPADRPSAAELERSQTLMKSLRASFFDVYFIYASTDLTVFQNINDVYLDYSELFLQLASASVHNVIEAVDMNIVQNEIPTVLMGMHCPFNGTTFEQTEYEDFVLPSRTKGYRIHPYYLRLQPLISVQFRNNGQGELLICTYRGVETSHTCQTLAERETFIYNLTIPCQSPEFCLPSHYTVSVRSTSNTCANTDCRLPNQVGYYIRHSGLNCLAIRGAAPKTSYWKLHIVLTLIISLFLIR
ncbi:uncharacterized protein LOC128676451 [Plodia interpunctella]|uniref:uncharacterized protein LOC128676451 n=1 Tax=Plodia interpunctella TaxID=58824 RepID=UPI002368539D|nr:uncharacterized protein LOC128676451 [Plodia interpunctella]